MYRVISAVLLVLTLAVSGVAVLMVRDRNRLLEHSAKAELWVKRLEEENQKLKDQISQEKEARVKAAAAAVATPPPAPAKDMTIVATIPAPSPNADASQAGNRKAGMKFFADMMKDPQMKEVMKQQQIAMLDSQYAGLFSRFHFNEGEQADFKKLLGERLSAESELGMKLLESDLTPEQRAALVKESEDAKNAADARIKDFLNSDTDYATFKNWEDTRAERTQLEMGRAIFNNSEPLSPQQEEQLIATMHQVNTQRSDGTEASRAPSVDASGMPVMDVDKQLARQDRNAEAILQASASFLSPKQLESLNAMQKQWRTMAETGMRMGAAMLKSQQGAPAGKP